MKKSSNTKLVKNTLFLYLRMIILMIVSLYTSRVVLNTLGIENFGVYNVVGGIVTLFAFLQNSMASATQRFLNFEMGKGDAARVRDIFSTSIIIHISLALLIVILAETVGLWFVKTKLVITPETKNAANWVYQFSVLTSVISITQAPYTAIIIANERMNVYGYFSIVEALLKLLLLYFLISINMDKLILYSILMFLSSMIVMFCYRVYCVKTFPESRFKLVKDIPLIKAMLEFSSWSLFGNLASVGMNQGQNILLNIFFGPVVNAARAIGVTVNSSVSQFANNFMVALNPQITKCYSSGEIGEMNKLIFRGAKFSYFLFFILASPLLIKTEEILDLWIKTPPKYAAIFCRLTLIDALIVTISGSIMTGVNSTGRIRKYQVVVGGLLLLNIPLSYGLLKLGLPPITVYVVGLSISLVAFVVRLYIANNLLKFGFKNFIVSVFCRCWLMFLIAIPIEYYVSNLFPISVFYTLLVMVISTLISILFVYTIGLTSKERKFTTNLIMAKLKLKINNSQSINKIKVWWCNEDNFGDQINPYLISKLTNHQVEYVEHISFYNLSLRVKIRLILSLFYRKGLIKGALALYNTFFVKKIFCVGSIIHRANRTCTVWGSGIMCEKDTIGAKQIYAVRGEYTKKNIVLPNKDTLAIGDPAILLPWIYNKPVEKRYKVGIIPHFVDYESVKYLSQNSDYLVIDLMSRDIEFVVDQIRMCEVILSSSLHGLIVAHSYNIPALWIMISSKIVGDNIKYNDYFSSVRIDSYIGFELSDFDITAYESVNDLFVNNKDKSLPNQSIIQSLAINLTENAPEEIEIKNANIFLNKWDHI